MQLVHCEDCGKQILENVSKIIKGLYTVCPECYEFYRVTEEILKNDQR